MISFWQVLILVDILAVSIFLGVIIGAYVVFRTKRETHERFLDPGASKGEVFSIDNFGEDKTEDAEASEQPSETIQARSMDFMSQFLGGSGE